MNRKHFIGILRVLSICLILLSIQIGYFLKEEIIKETRADFSLLPIGSYPSSDSAKGVFVRNGMAFIADQHQDLLIIDVAIPEHPMFISQAEFTSSTRYGIQVIDNYCYIAGWNNRLPIFNIQNPSSPTLVSSIYGSNDAHDFIIKNNYIYIADFIHGMYIYDINTPSSPVLIGEFSSGYQCVDIEIVDNYAYCATLNGILILNISDPVTIKFVNNYYTADRINGLIAQDNYLFVAGGNLGFLIYNISNPINPTLVSSYSTPGIPVRVELYDGFAYVCSGTGGLQIFDISNINDPTLVQSLTEYTEVSNVFIDENYVYMTNGASGLVIFSKSTDTFPPSSLSPTESTTNQNDGDNWIYAIIIVGSIIVIWFGVFIFWGNKKQAKISREDKDYKQEKMTDEFEEKNMKLIEKEEESYQDEIDESYSWQINKEGKE